jgi:LmbE family N-acetylglucosaminyl deacetylase
MSENRVIIFSPHPDDETLACGGTIAKRIREGYEVFVVFMTDARYSLRAVGITSGPSPQEISNIRREEAREAMKILGLQDKNLFFLNFEDQTLEAHYQDAKRIVLKILKDVSPIEVYFPQRKEYHRDHRITNFIVQEALSHLNLIPVRVQYAIAWAFPFNIMVHMLEEKKFISFMSNILNLDIIYVDISEFLYLKMKALEAYKTQLLAFSYQERKNLFRSSFLNRFLKKKESFFINSI